ncbi:hypothetical protein Gogos_018012 [Gossypium gossypioides]|uniref:Uncharacterized protein n=1 Tax=Gossypium gossypioides TaxID=34282 RepID=A0A7J9BCI9_GOSGO|nr:hypothetical protein [Gossypium gossypioides]
MGYLEDETSQSNVQSIASI